MFPHLQCGSLHSHLGTGHSELVSGFLKKGIIHVLFLNQSPHQSNKGLPSLSSLITIVNVIILPLKPENLLVSSFTLEQKSFSLLQTT